MTTAPTTLPSSSRAWRRSMATSSSPPPRSEGLGGGRRGPGWRGRGSRGSGRRCWRGGRRRLAGRGGRRRWRARSASRPAPVAALVGSTSGGPVAAAARSPLVQTREAGAVGEDRRDVAGRRRPSGSRGAGRRAAAWSARRCLGPGLDRGRGRLDAGGVDQLDGQAVAVAAGPRGSRGSCPARGETRARSRPSRALNSRLLPAFGGPTRTTRGMPLGPVAAAEPVGQGGDLGGGLGQLAGQRGAAERVDVGLVDEVEVGLEVGEDVEQAVAERGDRPGQAAGELLAGPRRAAPGSAASITPSTASARVRSIRPERKARRVNSPGSACRAPRGQAVGQDELDQRRRADRVDLGQGLPGVGPRARPERDRRRAAAAAGRRPAVAPSRRSARVGGGGRRRSGSKPARAIAQRLGPDQPDEPAEPGPGRAGDRGDRVGRVEGHGSGSRQAQVDRVDSRVRGLASPGACLRSRSRLAGRGRGPRVVAVLLARSRLR